MERPYDVTIGACPFMALAPQDAVRVRRGGVVGWAKACAEGWRLLSVQEAAMISLSAGWRPPDADVLLVSPPIADNRRRREVRGEVERSIHLVTVRPG